MAKKSFAVIGLGQFGISIVEELVGNGMDVIAIDSDEEAVKKVSSILPTVAVANSTDDIFCADILPIPLKSKCFGTVSDAIAA